MGKNKSKKSKNQNKMIKIVAALAAVVFLIYLLNLPGLFMKKEKGNEELNAALKNKTAFSFVKEGELSFVNNKDEQIVKIDVEIADDDIQRATGLMYREYMAENQGMLFIFPHESPQSFWMKNTILPLDIIFVDAGGNIVKIHKYTTPYSETSYQSGKPAKYVVEVNAGFADKYGIREGDRIVWRRL
ncbi:secreted protein containing DUF192 [Melioribacter roseus P3M-2]|uniref:Secreted protein containing DUF192 n=1 Tax=Melioribacter roseus (strain DSM 23840 / JCM 17771 / VKM B-2668 / P3M-2) TaxID=1191523 RepID=I6ZRL3_MELRP|nr:DUF192 domain-containing protein [Melioribacter roseus]AFN74709.1 secreted protein containing DUF192 [Melioribacter roseus P3M-2]